MNISVAPPYIGTDSVPSHDVPLPAHSEGDLLISFLQPSASLGESSGWTLIERVTTQQRQMVVLARIATSSSESHIVTFSGENRALIAHVYSVSGATNDLNEIYSEVAEGNGFQNPNFNPPSLTASGGTQEYFWFAASAARSSGSLNFSEGPTNYESQISNEPILTENQSLGTAYRVLVAETENPSAFVSSDQREWSAITLAITPGEASSPEPTPGLPATTIMDKDGNPLASTQVAVTVTAGATTLYDDTPTTDGSGLLPELDFSAHGSEPEVDDEVTWTITAGGITQSVTRTLVDLGD